MKRFPSIKKYEEFRRVYTTGKSRANRYLVMYLLENGTDRNRIGISASKKIGNSVIRHRMVRLVREAFRLHVQETKQGYDIVVVVRQTAVGQTYREIEQAYLHLLQLHGIKTGKEPEATVEVLNVRENCKDVSD